jgi:hypothetical protein
MWNRPQRLLPSRCDSQASNFPNLRPPQRMRFEADLFRSSSPFLFPCLYPKTWPSSLSSSWGSPIRIAG